MRFLHVADLHLDSAFAGSGLDGATARRRAEELFATFQSCLDLAVAEQVDAVIIAGDLFEHRWLRRETLRRVQQALERLAPTPVLIAAGNHDPLVADSPYFAPGWPEHVHIFGQAWEAVALPGGVTAWGRSFDRWETSERPLAGFAVPAGTLTLGVLHGSDMSVAPGEEGPYAPFTPAEVTATGFSYLALGHYHRCSVVGALAAGATGAAQVAAALTSPVRAAYPGPPEALSFGMQGVAHGALLGELTPAGARLRLIALGQREFRQLAIDISGLDTHVAVAGQVLAAVPAADRQRDFWRVTLTGQHDAALQLNLAELHEQLAPDFYALQLRSKATPGWDLATLALERSLRGEYVRQVQARLSALPTGAASDLERTQLELALALGLGALESGGSR